MQDHEFVFPMSHEDWMVLWHITPEGKSMSSLVGEIVHNYLSAQQGVQADGATTCAHEWEFPYGVADNHCIYCGTPRR